MTSKCLEAPWLLALRGVKTSKFAKSSLYSIKSPFCNMPKMSALRTPTLTSRGVLWIVPIEKIAREGGRESPHHLGQFWEVSTLSQGYVQEIDIQVR